MKSIIEKQTRHMHTERGQSAELSYIVFQQDGQFGMEIQMRKTTGTETARFCNLTSSAEKARTLQMLLADHLVTPVSMRDVLEDYFS